MGKGVRETGKARRGWKGKVVERVEMVVREVSAEGVEYRAGPPPPGP